MIGGNHFPNQGFKKGYTPWNKGKKLSQEHIQNICLNQFHPFGKNSPNWLDGFGNIQSQERINKLHREWRHRTGISKRYNSELGISYTKEYRQVERQKRRALEFGGGELSIKTVQQVYENNIKKYGTLICIYCLEPIEFGKDTLEHKQPLSKNGTNDYENLAVACKSCNSKKKDKTYREFIAIQKGDF